MNHSSQLGTHMNYPSSFAHTWTTHHSFVHTWNTHHSFAHKQSTRANICLSIKYFVQLCLYGFLLENCTCTFVYVCKPLLKQVYWHVLQLCYIHYSDKRQSHTHTHIHTHKNTHTHTHIHTHTHTTHTQAWPVPEWILRCAWLSPTVCGSPTPSWHKTVGAPSAGPPRTDVAPPPVQTHSTCTASVTHQTKHTYLFGS